MLVPVKPVSTSPSVAPVIKMTCSVSGLIWSFLSLKSLFGRRRSWGSCRLLPALALVQFDQLLDGRRILRLLVSLPEGNQPRKAQRIARLRPDFARRMDRRARDLVGQHFDHKLRLDPHARLDERGDASWPVIDFQSPGALPDTAPLVIA